MLAVQWAAPAAIAQQQTEAVQVCSEEFWRRAVTVATGHGTGFEIEARQIGRDLCFCRFDVGKPKVCEASVVSEAEALPPEIKK